VEVLLPGTMTTGTEVLLEAGTTTRLDEPEAEPEATGE